jgi:hypothetical protein
MNSAVLLAEETVICRSFVQFCANFFGAGANNDDVILLLCAVSLVGATDALLYIQTIPYSLALPRGGVRFLRGDDLRKSRTNTPPRGSHPSSCAAASGLNAGPD